MKKRILSLILVLSMAVAWLPLGIAPVPAAETPVLTFSGETEIGTDALYSSIGLRSLAAPVNATLLDGVTSTDNSAFSGFTGLASDFRWKSVTNIANSTFSGYISLANDSGEREFRYRGGDAFHRTEGNFTSSYSYSDAFFEDTSYNYRQDLATMSLCLAMAAYGQYGGDYIKTAPGAGDPKRIAEIDANQRKDYNVRELLKSIGFKDKNIDTSLGYPNQPETHTIGAAIALKALSSHSNDMLLVVVLRGGGYEKEWGGNFFLDHPKEEHGGFRYAREAVLFAIDNYLDSHANEIKGKKLRMWITGYSRGSAVANLLGAHYVRLAELSIEGVFTRWDFQLLKENIFTYCFETPAVTTAADTVAALYKNIFCIVNPNDFVPKFAPGLWDYHRYGNTLYLPCAETTPNYSDFEENMLAKWDALNKSEDAFFLKEDYAIEKFKFTYARYSYRPYTLPMWLRIEKDLHFIVYKQSIFLDKFFSAVLVQDKFKSAFNYTKKYQNDMVEIFTKFGAEELRWRDALNDVGLLALNTVIANNADFQTLLYNGEGILQGHYPELCLAWMQSLSDAPDLCKQWLNNQGIDYSAGAKYRIVRINRPVDVAVYDSNNNLVASIIDGEPQNITGISIFSTIDDSMQKSFYFPASAGYKIEITATDDCFVAYSVSEFDRNVGEVTRLVNYYEIETQLNETLTGVVPSLIDSPDGFYGLFDNNNQPITPSEDTADVIAINYEGSDETQGNGYIDVGEADWFYEAVNFVAEEELINGVASASFSPNASMSRAMMVTVLWRFEGSPDVKRTYANVADVTQNSWYEKAIGWAFKNKIVLGYPGRLSKPDDPITREEAVTILYRYAKFKKLNVNATADLSGINDTDDISDWATDAMKWAVATGITQGRLGNELTPDANCTRAELATILKRFGDFLEEID